MDWRTGQNGKSDREEEIIKLRSLVEEGLYRVSAVQIARALLRPKVRKESFAPASSVRRVSLPN